MCRYKGRGDVPRSDDVLFRSLSSITGMRRGEHRTKRIKKSEIPGPSPSENVLFMYRKRILCTLYGAVDFFNVLKKGCLGGWGGGGWQRYST
jgi:hypothetical protein